MILLPGICTIQLLNVIQQAHNDVLVAFEKRMGIAGRLPASLPVVSHRTPREILSRKFIVYDRQSLLLPVLYDCSRQSLGYNDRSKLTYDFARVEERLTQALLVGQHQVALQVWQYQYSGQLRQAGALSRLQMRVQQEMLSASVCAAIREEVDTQHRWRMLLSQMEDCIQFLVSIGGANVKGIQGGTLLSSYITDVLLVRPETWMEMSTPSLRQHVQLKHLQALFILLEEDEVRQPEVCATQRTQRQLGILGILLG